MKFCFNCKDAAERCDKHQYQEMGFFDTLMMKVHFFLCRSCRRHSKKNKQLTESIKAADIQCLCSEDKAKLRDRLKEEIDKLSDQ